MRTEKFDVDVSRGARLLSKLTGSAKKLGETNELKETRQSIGHDKDAREGATAVLIHLLTLLACSMGMEGAAKKGNVQIFGCRHRLHGQSMAERFNVFETAVPDMQSADLTVELSNMGWHFIEISWDREERLLEATKGGEREKL